MLAFPIPSQNHAILFQYTELLAALTEPDQLAKLLPSVPTLITTFHLSPSIAFDLARPKLRLAMRHYDEKEAAEQEARRKKGLLEKLQREKKVASASNSAKPASADAQAEGEGMKLDTVVVDGQDVKMEDVKVEDVKMEDLEAVANNALIETNGDETPRSATPSSGPVRFFHCVARLRLGPLLIALFPCASHGTQDWSNSSRK